jgi:hypothetical protein
MSPKVVGLWLYPGWELVLHVQSSGRSWDEVAYVLSVSIRKRYMYNRGILVFSKRSHGIFTESEKDYLKDRGIVFS